MKRSRLSVMKLNRFSAVTLLLVTCLALISSGASKADSDFKTSGRQVKSEKNQHHQDFSLSQRQPDKSSRVSTPTSNRFETQKVNQTEEAQYSEDDFSPANSTCSYGTSEVTCCNEELGMCLVSEWHPVEPSSGVPNSASVALNPIIASPDWDGIPAIFERDFGFCARSAKHEYCFESDSNELTIYDWKREDNGSVVLMNRTLFDSSSSTD